MPTHILRETNVTVHAHPLSLREYYGIPVSVELDDKTHQLTVDSVTIAGGSFSVAETVTFRNARIEYDDGAVNIVP